MTAPADFVSVVMPVYNGERFLRDAVESVRAQGHPRLELIVVDDGSTDSSARIAQELAADPANRIRYHRKENGGVASARNAGIALAQGPLIAFIDVDDLWPPGKLASQLASLAADPALDVVLGHVQYVAAPGFDGLPKRLQHVTDPVVHVNLGSGVFRKRAFDAIGAFDPALRHGEDTDWILRALEAELSLKVLSRVTLIYRHHDANLTRDTFTAARSVMAVLRRSLERRRRAGGGTIKPIRQLTELVEPAPDGR